MTPIVPFFFLGIAAAVVQTTLFQYFPTWLGRPDLIYILVSFAAYRFTWFRGLIFVFAMGWMMDVVSGIHLGAYPLQYVVVFFFLKTLTENSPLKETAYQVPLVGLSYFIMQMTFYFLYSILAPDTMPAWSWGRVIQETIILLVATVPSFLVFNAFYEFFNKRRVIHKVIRKRSGNQFR